jgi:hypothetical protein
MAKLASCPASLASPSSPYPFPSPIPFSSHPTATTARERESEERRRGGEASRHGRGQRRRCAPLAGVPRGLGLRETSSSGAYRRPCTAAVRASVPAQHRGGPHQWVAPAPSQSADGDDALQVSIHNLQFVRIKARGHQNGEIWDLGFRDFGDFFRICFR